MTTESTPAPIKKPSVEDRLSRLEDAVECLIRGDHTSAEEASKGITRGTSAMAQFDAKHGDSVG